MKTNEKHLADLKEIRNLMEKSSRFLSLSGLSGISAGIIAIVGALTAWIFFRSNNIYYDEFYHAVGKNPDVKVLRFLIMDGSLILLMAVGFGFYFSYRKARRMNMLFWNPASKRLLINLFIPLTTGGIVCIILLFREGINLIIPMMLLFYGLGLINAGKYTQYNINYLGITEIVTGLLAMIFIDHSFYFWILGFGVWHILYGAIYYYRYERKEAVV